MTESIRPIGLCQPESGLVFQIKQPLLDGTAFREERVVTQYLSPLQYGCLALLGHNTYLSDLIKKINNNIIFIIYNTERFLKFQHVETQIWEAKTPTSDISDFKCRSGSNWSDLSKNGINPWISHDELFNRLYGGKFPLVIQTCIPCNGDVFGARQFMLFWSTL